MTNKNYLVLARKHRPSKFSDLKGQEFIVTTIVNAIKLNRIAHTFLFTGIRGSGKTTIARILARTFNCTSPIISDKMVIPCEKCNNCKASFTDKHPDIIELDAASRTGVNDAREIIENSNYLPILGKYKIFIIDEVHMLSTSAFNALLKTLEEPPEHVKFIFATTELRKIPITILSRCQKFELKRLSIEEITKHLVDILKTEKIEADDDAIQLIAAQAGGSVRDSLSLLDLVISNSNMDRITKENAKELFGYSNLTQLLILFSAIIEGKTVEAITIVKDLYYLGKDLNNLFQQMLELVHLLTKHKLQAEINTYEYNDEDLVKLSNISEICSITSLTTIWQMLLKGIQELQMSKNQLITSEMLIIRLCHLSNLPSLSSLISRLNNQSSTEFSQTNSLPPRATKQKPNFAVNSFEDLVELFHQKKEMLLYQYLLNDVSLIDFEPCKIKISHSKNVPHHFANKVASLLQDWTGEKWHISVSSGEGNPTLADQAHSAKLQLMDNFVKNDFIKEVLDNFADVEIKDIIKH